MIPFVRFRDTNRRIRLLAGSISDRLSSGLVRQAYLSVVSHRSRANIRSSHSQSTFITVVLDGPTVVAVDLRRVSIASLQNREIAYVLYNASHTPPRSHLRNGRPAGKQGGRTDERRMFLHFLWPCNLFHLRDFATMNV